MLYANGINVPLKCRIAKSVISLILVFCLNILAQMCKVCRSCFIRIRKSPCDLGRTLIRYIMNAEPADHGAVGEGSVCYLIAQLFKFRFQRSKLFRINRVFGTSIACRRSPSVATIHLIIGRKLGINGVASEDNRNVTVI